MNQERLMNILLAPIVSEKSSRLADENRQFAFKVQALDREVDCLGPERVFDGVIHVL